MRLRHGGEKSLQAPKKRDHWKVHLPIELGGCDVLDKKTKVKFNTTTHYSKDLLDCVHVSI